MRVRGISLLLTLFLILFFALVFLVATKGRLRDYDNSETVTSGGINNIICHDKGLKSYVERRGNFYVFYNFVRALNTYGYRESITLTAPGDFRFLDNVLPLVDRWDGPISVALYAPGDDFFTTVDAIAYLRGCTKQKVVETVTFHVFFDIGHVPKQKDPNIPLHKAYKDSYNCSKPPPWHEFNDADMYKSKNGLLYPINVARNVAKVTAQTHFVFPSDIELYPTRDFVRKFLDMVARQPELFKEGAKNVFVLPIFEILGDHEVPTNKSALQHMLSSKSAFLFHKTVCPECHKIPSQDDWAKSPETHDLGVFVSKKRQGQQLIWEPFFVCTGNEPLWDERLSWEGQGNKMSQAFTMCLLDYDFNVLDNAFLIHKPGVKKKKVQNVKHKDQLKINNEILRGIQRELFAIYGANKKCRIHYV